MINPIIVICESCGVVYDYVTAEEKCPNCGDSKHRVLSVMFYKGSQVYKAERKTE